MDGSKFSKAMNAVGGGLGVIGSLTGAYMGVPKSQSNKSFLKKASMVGRTRYGASDMAGLMSQWENTPTLQNISREDLYNPSGEEMFASMFGAGMGSYGAMSGLTSPLMSPNAQVMKSSTQTPSAMGNPTGDITTSEAIRNATSREEQFDEGEKAVLHSGNLVEAGTLRGLQPVATENQPEEVSPFNVNGWINTDADPTLEGMYVPAYNGQPRTFGCGGHKFGNGGLTFQGFDANNALATGLNLLSGGIGVALNYAGTMAQKRKAEM